MKSPCKGPGHNGSCGRPAKTKGLCSSHDWQVRSRGNEALLTPLLPQGGKLYDNPTRLEIRNVPKEHVHALSTLGNDAPAFDTRHAAAANLGARYLVKSWAEGRVSFKASHRPGRFSSAQQRRASDDTETVDLRSLEAHEMGTLEVLGASLPVADGRDRNAALRGARWLIQALHEGGLKIRLPKKTGGAK